MRIEALNVMFQCLKCHTPTRSTYECEFDVRRFLYSHMKQNEKIIILNRMMNTHEFYVYFHNSNLLNLHNYAGCPDMSAKAQLPICSHSLRLPSSTGHPSQFRINGTACVRL